MKGHAFCTANAIKLILLSALTQVPQARTPSSALVRQRQCSHLSLIVCTQVGGVKRHSGVDFDELLTMLK